MKSHTLLAAAVALVASGCGGGAVSDDPPRSAASGTPDELATAELIFDGDSLEVRIDGRVKEVRLLGINAPERDECHGNQSREALTVILESADELSVTSDGEETDRFGRRLRFLSADGIDINALLIATGDALAIQTGQSRERTYVELMRSAFAAGSGMWAIGVCGEMTIAEGDIIVGAVEFNPPGRDEENLNEEFVKIGNTSGGDIDVSGWVLRDESTANRFVFPNGTVIAAGDTLVVHSGCETDKPSDVYWCNDTPVWSNGGDSALLQDELGNVVDLHIYGG